MPQYKPTTALKRITAMTKRLRAVPGGTRASKTISILVYLIACAQHDTAPTITSVVAESIPALKRGAIRDFKSIMQAHNYWDDNQWNQTDFIYTFETGSIIEFFSADQPDKLRGAGRDRLFINEANNVSFEAFDQLDVRTRQFVFLDWNPSHEFWYYTELKGNRDDLEEITLTYKDNEGLEPEVVANIESRKNRTGWWLVYGLGQLGEVEGRIYTGWAIIDEVPHAARLERYGVDFGYTNDPSAIVGCYYYDGGYILDEVAYAKGLSNKQIADILLNQPKRALAVADSAEPKSIDEIRLYGISIIPCEKGKDSVRQGIQMVQEQQISVTKRSVNLIKEYRNYLWATDKDGNYIQPNEPEHEFSHSMDAIRYAMQTLISYHQRREMDAMRPRWQERERVNPAR